ncbi:hypothetical protein GCM10009087_29990 [Sphingomonas oligophenolica]|uniref:VOC family protein n=1 Tax=Sphingomonas oligophenolica TaxID=301154 RepID=A0ABU9YBS6_9SPHN
MLIPNPTGLANIMQTAWVTPDLDRSMDQFARRFKLQDFFTTDIAIPARLRDETGEMALRIALANVDNIQIELIQPVGGGIDRIYRDALPSDGSHANVFHHCCVKIAGPIDRWNAYIAELEKKTTIDYTGDSGPNVRFVYTDERETIGIWLEHVWYEPSYDAEFSALIPTYRSA